MVETTALAIVWYTLKHKLSQEVINFQHTISVVSLRTLAVRLSQKLPGYKADFFLLHALLQWLCLYWLLTALQLQMPSHVDQIFSNILFSQLIRNHVCNLRYCLQQCSKPPADPSSERKCKGEIHNCKLYKLVSTYWKVPEKEVHSSNQKPVSFSSNKLSKQAMGKRL